MRVNFSSSIECGFRSIQLEFDKEYWGVVDNCQQTCCVAYLQNYNSPPPPPLELDSTEICIQHLKTITVYKYAVTFLENVHSAVNTVDTQLPKNLRKLETFLNLLQYFS